MQERLSRELRDMVYKHLLGPGSIVTVDQNGSEYGFPAKCVLACNYPYVVNPQYVGSETRLELVELCYRSSVFFLDYMDDVTSLFAYDPWGMDLDPRQHVHSVTAEIAPTTGPPTKN
jgi:hypothetical protein